MDRIDSVDTSFYQDTSRLKNLKGREGLEAAAREFEAMFLQMVLKNMRDASKAIADENSFLSSQQQGFYQEMADGQMATEMAKRGHLGIAEAMVKQMGRSLGDAEFKKAEQTVATDTLSSAAFQQPLNKPHRNGEH